MSLMEYLEEPKWGSEVEIERRNRIRLSVAAYAYEFCDDAIMSDAEFDALALKINPTMQTTVDMCKDKSHDLCQAQRDRVKKLDRFFSTHFDSSTGMWARSHPEKEKLHDLYLRIKKYQKK